MQAITLINLCAREYQDVLFERITKAKWLDYLNDAQRAIVLVRPDANSVTAAVQLAAGTRQTLPAAALRLLDASRNMGSQGTTAGDTIRFAEREVHDIVSRSWHKSAPTPVVREIFYNDKNDPRAYWVYPPVPSGTAVFIEITTSNVPTEVTDADNGAITLSDVYAAPMQHWMLYRVYLLATQALNQFQRAQFYFSSFFNLLGVKARNDMFFSPNEPAVLPGAQGAAR
jgi:hypothetical protein